MAPIRYKNCAELYYFIVNERPIRYKVWHEAVAILYILDIALTGSCVDKSEVVLLS